MLTLANARITEIVVEHQARQFGQSKYNISRVWRVISDLMLVKMLTDFAARPGLWFCLLSMPAIASGMVFLVQGLITSASVVFLGLAFLCFALAGHFLLLGVLGEMVLNTGDFQPHRYLAKTWSEKNMYRGCN
jgi:Na+/melibiose symporter-like transporter